MDITLIQALAGTLTPSEEVAQINESIQSLLADLNRQVERHNSALKMAKSAKSEFGRQNAMGTVCALKASIANGKDELARLRQIVAAHEA